MCDGSLGGPINPLGASCADVKVDGQEGQPTCHVSLFPVMGEAQPESSTGMGHETVPLGPLMLTETAAAAYNCPSMSVLPKKRLERWQRVAPMLTAASIAGAIGFEATAAGRNAAKELECPAAGTRAVSFARAVDGGGFVTADGEEVRLSGILAFGVAGETASSEAVAAARGSLEKALSNRTISLASAETSRDRYGRSVAQVFADGTWVQAALLKAGEVRAAPDRASAPCAKALLAAEDDARSSRVSRWRGAFRVRGPQELRNSTGSFQIVEGDVVTATVNRGRAFINFGADYRSDFTVTIDPEDMRTFRQARFDIPALAGKRIRVRGWVEFYNGPEITLAVPEAIEVLE
jgi:endonuclease YncB( thermonuclease family)